MQISASRHNRPPASQRVAGVFADVGDNPDQSAPASAREPDSPVWNDQPSPDRLPELTCCLLNTFKKTHPLEKFVTHEFPVDQVDKAMAQAFDIDACMKVVLKPSGG